MEKFRRYVPETRPPEEDESISKPLKIEQLNISYIPEESVFLFSLPEGISKKIIDVTLEEYSSEVTIIRGRDAFTKALVEVHLIENHEQEDQLYSIFKVIEDEKILYNLPLQ